MNQWPVFFPGNLLTCEIVLKILLAVFILSRFVLIRKSLRRLKTTPPTYLETKSTTKLLLFESVSSKKVTLCIFHFLRFQLKGLISKHILLIFQFGNIAQMKQKTNDNIKRDLLVQLTLLITQYPGDQTLEHFYLLF